MTGAAVDRRHRRRQETLREVLDVSVAVMADQGVAGLTLGEVARRMGIRPPSLYGYFDGKNALYDALFQRGWAELLEVLHGQRPGTADPVEELQAGSEVFVRWAVEHPALAPLMFWRPIPGFSPSPTAYAPAVQTWQLTRELLERLLDAGRLAPGTDLARAQRGYAALLTGIVTQQLANHPGEPFDTGTYTALLPELITMWLAHHGARAGTQEPVVGGTGHGDNDGPPTGRSTRGNRRTDVVRPDQEETA